MPVSLHESIADEHLPQIRALVDAERMQGVFAEEVHRRTAGRLRLDGCQIARVKYRPGKNCLVTCRLSVLDSDSGERSVQMATLLGCGAGESERLFSAAPARRSAPTWLGDAVLHLPALEAVVWIFPHDRRLGGLPALMAATRPRSGTEAAGPLIGPLTGVMARNFEPDWGIIGVEREIAHYAAERSCTVRARLTLRHPRTGASAMPVFYGKTYRVGESEKAWRRQSSLWEAAARRRGELLIPQPLAFWPESETIWQEGLAGRKLAEEKAAELGARLDAAGAAVAALHRAGIGGALRVVTTGEILERIRETAELLVRLWPERREGVKNMVDGLLARAPQSGAGREATLHGDLHLNNLLSISGGIALLDLDNLSRGDAHIDLGSFRAALFMHMLRRGGTIAEAEQLAGRFVGGYRARGGEVSTSLLEWWTAAALLYERAWRLVTKLKADGAELIDKLVALAGRRR